MRKEIQNNSSCDAQFLAKKKGFREIAQALALRDDDQFIDAVRTVAAGGTMMDPDVVAKLLGRRAKDEPLARLSAREREVLELMAEGRSNSAIAQRLFVTEKAVSKHSTSIFAKLDLAPSDDDNRRVLAVLAYLNT